MNAPEGREISLICTANKYKKPPQRVALNFKPVVMIPLFREQKRMV
jgi:hypothetical protein